MRGKWLALLLSGALTLSFAACASGEENPKPAPAPSQRVETGAAARPVETDLPSVALSLPPEADAPEAPGAAPGGAPLAFSPPRRDYRSWQVGYMDFLTALFQAGGDARGGKAAFGALAADDRGVKLFDNLWEAMEMGSEDYSLYDVDGDGVPELFVRYGNCEAAYTTQCYTWRDGRVVCAGEFDAGHSSLYTDPGKSAVVRSAGHMGYKEVYEYPMEGGRLTEERVLFSEEDVWEYTPTEEIVPGAELIDCYRTELCRRMDFPSAGQEQPLAGKPLLLPITDWYDGPAATGSSSQNARTAILAVLSGEAELYGCSGEGYYGGVGRTTWADYVQPEAAYPYNDGPLEIRAHVWQDMNGDGQEECVLQLDEAERGEETAARGRYIAVLSEQEGVVYAYFFGFLDEIELWTDGTFNCAWTYGGYDQALSFWQDQCCQYAVADHAAGDPVQWLDGPPAG